MSERILVTAALPYANGSIHLGHLLEHVLTDIYVRALRMAGEDAVFICADDTHGTPIELGASKAGVSPEDFVARFAKEHLEDFAAFEIGFDHFDSTNSEENRRWANEIYSKLKQGGYVHQKVLKQLYDEKAGRFLPDRFVKGVCPKCGAKDQYGDVCEVCGSTYEPTDLKEPYSVVSGSTPVLRDSEHFFVDLSAFKERLAEWTSTPGRLQPETRNFVETWIAGGLRDWCISRDAPYFGFEIPDAPGKFFYVWLDAPIGYISATERWAKKIGQPGLSDAIWRRGEARIEHVIGKDIVYFHTLFWPAMLSAAGLTTPSRVQVHGMLTVDGVKMSKARGTFINARTFREHLDPAYLRYYYASKLGPKAEDVDLSLDEFVNRVNSELVNTLANLVARCVPFIKDKLEGRYGKLPADAGPHLELVRARAKDAETAYRAFDSASASRAAVEIASLGNRLFQDAEPWKRVHTDPEGTRDLVTLCLNLARAATVLIAPAVPSFAAKVYPMLGLEGGPRRFDEAVAFDLIDRAIGTPGRVMDRITKKQLDVIIDASREGGPATEAPAEASDATVPSAPAQERKAPPGQATRVEPGRTSRPPRGPATSSAIATQTTVPAAQDAKTEASVPAGGGEADDGFIGIDEFHKVDLRVGLIVAAELVEGADKLLRLSVDLGEARPRNIFAGIRSAFAPEAVVGLRVAVVANLKPRKMRFGVSEGMVLAAGPGGKELFLLTLPPGAPPGSEIR